MVIFTITISLIVSFNYCYSWCIMSVRLSELLCHFVNVERGQLFCLNWQLSSLP